jgi:hypothetical protein
VSALHATTGRWFCVAMLLLAAALFIGIGGKWIIAGIGCLGWAGARARV